MDSAEMMLNNPILSMPLESLSQTPSYQKIAKLREGEPGEISDDEKEQIAKDFESVLLHKLFDEMKNTIENWGGDEDVASEQVQGIFWLYLSRHIADNGGLGMWKDIYQYLNSPNQTNTTTKSLDKNI
jgi:Rod binding domain-containing protein